MICWTSATHPWCVLDPSFVFHIVTQHSGKQPEHQSQRDVGVVQAPTASKIYYRCFKVQEQLADFEKACCSAPDQVEEGLQLLCGFDTEVVQLVQRCFRNRWDMLQSHLHTAAYALDPEFIREDIFKNKEVMSGVHFVIEHMAGSTNQIAQATLQFYRFRDPTNPMSGEGAMATAKQSPAWKWWSLYGFHYPELQKVAIKVTAQVVSATSCERAWSAFGHVHTASRNRMTADKATVMTSVYWNLRLRDRLCDVNDHEYFEWDELLDDESDE